MNAKRAHFWILAAGLLISCLYDPPILGAELVRFGMTIEYQFNERDKPRHPYDMGDGTVLNAYVREYTVKLNVRDSITVKATTPPGDIKLWTILKRPGGKRFDKGPIIKNGIASGWTSEPVQSSGTYILAIGAEDVTAFELQVTKNGQTPVSPANANPSVEDLQKKIRELEKRIEKLEKAFGEQRP